MGRGWVRPQKLDEQSRLLELRKQLKDPVVRRLPAPLHLHDESQRVLDHLIRD